MIIILLMKKMFEKVKWPEHTTLHNYWFKQIWVFWLYISVDSKFRSTPRTADFQNKPWKRRSNDHLAVIVYIQVTFWRTILLLSVFGFFKQKSNNVLSTNVYSVWGNEPRTSCLTCQRALKLLKAVYPFKRTSRLEAI